MTEMPMNLYGFDDEQFVILQYHVFGCFVWQGRFLTILSSAAPSRVPESVSGPNEVWFDDELFGYDSL